MKVLIVDDEIYAVQGIIDDVNWKMFSIDEVLTANSCGQAIRILQDTRIDIMICDIEMPAGSGIDLVRWIREQEGMMIECIFLTCHPDFKFAQQAVQLECLDYILKPATTDQLHACIRKAVKKVTERNKDKLIREYGMAYLGSNPESEEKDIVRQVEQYIREHISEPLRVEELAQMYYISPTHLSRLFRKKHRMSVIEYIIEQKLQLAKSLLENPAYTVSMVSSSVGYTNYSYFTKIFKKAFGVSPSEYKRQVIV